MKTLLACLLLIAFPATSNDMFLDAFRVSITLTGKDKSANESVSSFIKRELRGLRDVNVVEDATANYNLGVIVMPVDDGNGSKLGFVVSCVVTTKTPPGFWSRVVGTNASESVVSYLEMVAQKESLYVDHYLHTSPPDGLKRACEALVVQFDTMLEDRRKSREKLSEILKRTKDGGSSDVESPVNRKQKP